MKSTTNIYQLRKFLKQYKSVDGLYFELHFTNYSSEKLILDLNDFVTKLPLVEPIFSPECFLKNNLKNSKAPKICLINIETLNELMGSKDFDIETTIKCPSCMNVLKIMSFNYETSIKKILEKIEKFSSQITNKIFKISIKLNYQWKTKNHLYLKGNLKNDSSRNNNYEFFGNYNYEEFFKNKNVINHQFIQDFSEPEVSLSQINENLENSINHTCFYFWMEKNTNSIIIVKYDNKIFKMWRNRIIVQKFNSTPFIFYDNYEFLVSDSKDIIIFTDGASILKGKLEFHENEDQIENSFFEKDVFLQKVYSFKQRFFSPKIHLINECLYVFGGISLNKDILLNSYKISLDQDKKCLGINIIQKMPNMKKNHLSILNSKKEKIYFFGGDFFDEKLTANNSIDIYDFLKDSWNIALISYNINELTSHKIHSLLSFDEKIIFFGNDYKNSFIFDSNSDLIIEVKNEIQSKKQIELFFRGLDLFRENPNINLSSGKNIISLYKLFSVVEH